MCDVILLGRSQGFVQDVGLHCIEFWRIRKQNYGFSQESLVIKQRPGWQCSPQKATQPLNPHLLPVNLMH
jgi:hypothetical protein